MAIKLIEENGRTLALGRLSPARTRGLQMRMSYYMQPGLPKPPEACDYSPKAMPAIDKMYLNDRLGDCVIAGMAHSAGIFTGNAGEPPLLFSDDAIVGLYGAIGGYNPSDPSTDQGCQETVAMAYWQQKGLFADGSHKISGWMLIDPTDIVQVRTAIWLFEIVFYGIALPDQWISPLPTAGFTWDVAGDPDQQNGHAFVGMAYDKDKIKISTWGMEGYVTNAATAKYAAATAGGQLYAVLSPDIISRAEQRAPNGFDFTQLTQDIAFFQPGTGYSSYSKNT
jgi:hypothetical protein